MPRPVFYDTASSTLKYLTTSGEANVPLPTASAGESAYQLAVNNGFTGTVSEWLDSLKGEQGEAGTGGGALPFLNLADPVYGIVGDGVTDDTEAFNDAIEWYYKNDDDLNRGAVYVPAGSFLINPSIGIKLLDNVDIIGAGWGSTQFITSSGAGSVFKRPATGRAQYQRISNIRIVLTDEGQIGIDSTASGRAVYERVQITTQARKSINGVGEWFNTPNTVLAGSIGIKLNFTQGIGGDGQRIKDCLFIYMEEGVQIAGGHGHNIVGNEFQTCALGINCNQSVSGGLNITHNLIQYWGSGNRGIDFMGVDSNITHNYFENNISGAQQAILLRTGSARNKVDHNGFFLYSPASTVKVHNDGTNNVVVL